MFDFSTFPELATPRLELRKLTSADVPAMRNLFSAPEVLRYLNSSPTDTDEKALDLINWLNDQFDHKNGVNWAIVLNGEDDRFVGQCGTHGWDESNRHVDIGYHILPVEWGKGYATEASHAVIRWCFEQLGVHRVQADCTDGNIGSERVLLKCGFTVEGVWRESCWEHGRFVNIKQFGLLRREFESR
ncbi:MAG: GNAT family protein [Anaerolineae bacterium]